MKKLLPVLAIPLLIVACAKNPSEGKEKVKVEAAASAPTSDAAAVKKRFAFTTQTASLNFVGAKLTAQHEGSFPDVSGIVELTGDTVESARLKLTVGLASLQIEPAKLAGHLKSADFFDVEKFPKATFESTAVTKAGEKGYTIQGNLSLHGVTKQITFPATAELTGEAFSANAEFAINRKDFGIVYPGAPDDLIKDDVLLKIRLVAKAN